MTNTWTMMRTLTRQRSLTAFKTFIVTLVATVVSILLAMFTGEAKITVDFVLTLLFAYAVIGGLVFFVRLAIIQERVWVNNYYRSVPTTNLKLYTANLLATCLSFLIYAAFEGVVLLALAVTRWGINLPTGDPMTVLVEMGIFLIVLGIFIWAFISLVHLLSVTIMAFLPETRIRLVQWIIYLVVIIVASFMFDQVQRLFLLPFGGYDSNTLTGSSSVLVGIGIFIVTILLISAVNVYLLEKWVETK